MKHAILHTLAAVSAVCTGCTTTYRIDVDAATQAAASARPTYAYRLSPAVPDRAPDDPVVQRVARDIRTALSSKGLFEAPDGVTPGLDIEFDFGLNGPELVERTRPAPVSSLAMATSLGSSGPMGWRAPGDHTFGDGVPNLPAAETITEVVKVYHKFLRLTARASAARAPGVPPAPRWSVYVEYRDESRNLQKSIRLLTAAAMDVIGQDTSTRRTVAINDRDDRVLFVTTGLDE